MSIFLVLVSQGALGETTTLSLPAKATITFDAPQMTKLSEKMRGDVYQYMASSAGVGDGRFSLSIYVEPIDCQYGKSLQDVTRCFLERSENNPTLIKESQSTRCDKKRCEVLYVTAVNVGDKVIRQLHTNTLMVYRELWVDIHISVVTPTKDDSPALARFAGSLVLVPPQN